MTSVVTFPAAFVKYAETLRSDAARGRFYHELCLYFLTGREPNFTGALAAWFETVKGAVQFFHKNGAHFPGRNGTENKEKSAPENGEKTQDPEIPASKPLPFAPLLSDQTNVPGPTLLSDQTNETRGADAAGRALAGGEETYIPGISDEHTNEKEEEKESKEKKTKEESSFSPLIPEHLRTPAFQAKWEEWELFRRRKRKPVTLMAAKLQLKRLGAFSEEVARAMIDQSIANDWQGIFPLERGSGPAAEPPRDYTGI